MDRVTSKEGTSIPLVYFAAFRDHCSLYPATAKVLEAHREELKPYFSGKGTLRFTEEGPIPDALVRKIVKTRIEEIETAGSGYRRRAGRS